MQSATENSDPRQGSARIGRLIMKLRRLERQPHRFGAAGCLTPSEIHTIDAIGMGGGMLMSELAARLGITKGAVTQLVSRLEGKACVQRRSHATDSRATLVSLSTKGEQAYLAHRQLNQKFYERLGAQLTAQEIAVFEKCVDIFCEVLDE
ncbi:MarR family winged helix-turn-helix transcriptional regulator [Propionispora vibrioides]|uniref:DNA-binding transcriptional regulator, MarR family n=1 Tax=Propionispora vibrioides TaxID=112903 RepID=A0A1H8W0B2_9FIRM|nr:MarR family transcriptional regulator [Propionispora vibrioides]SEP21035.1 DNA-binding transcriptional regulator, MarR family [Propionispora vibrioides]